MSAPIDWGALMTAPGALEAILAEVFRSEDAEGARRYRNRHMTRLAPAQPVRDIADVHDALYPKYSLEPFSESIKPLCRPSIRALAQRAGVADTVIRHATAGRRPVTRHLMEALARGARVHPGYFLEYRQLVVAEAIKAAMARDGAAGITAFQRVLERTAGR